LKLRNSTFCEERSRPFLQLSTNC